MLLVFGSLNVDYVFALEHLPKPGETCLTSAHHLYSGGKGANQAVASARLDVPTIFYGCKGADGGGHFLTQRLSGQEDLTLRLQETQQAGTGSAFICVDKAGENLITVSIGANHFLEASSVSDEDLGNATVVLLQMEVDPAQNLILAKRAKAAGKTVILNYAPALDAARELLSFVSVIIVNEHELVMLLQACGHRGVRDHLQNTSALAVILDCCVITTLGDEGVLCVDQGRGRRLSALSITPVDTTGAGDAFVGAFAGLLSVGMTFDEALQSAVVAGSISCTALGAQDSYVNRATIMQYPVPAIERFNSFDAP
jgi:ribokinase